jgi:LysR family transcriptional regulator, transcriptional activator of nhaA
VAALNYHHLRYFQAIARERSLTRAAQILHVSQSALSTQLRVLEDRLGHPLFERVGRRLELTEAGRIALDHADSIFRTGDELLQTLAGRAPASRQRLRIGSAATLSRNFQLEFLRPLLARDDVELSIHSGTLRDLVAQLSAHLLDVVLANSPVPRESSTVLYSHLIAQQPVSLVSRPAGRGEATRLRFPRDLEGRALALPAHPSSLRAAFDLELERAGVQARLLAEVDDMAMLRLVARESGALTLVPQVVVRDELVSGVLVERARLRTVKESFYAVTGDRRFPHPLLRELLPGRARRG